jgi:flotillin
LTETPLGAEAEAAKARADGNAEAEKLRAAGSAKGKMSEADGDAYSERTVAAAQADVYARAKALDDGNQALIAANRLVDVLPELVEASSRGLVGANLTVLNGADGVAEVLTSVVGQGLSIYESLRKSVAQPPVARLDGAQSDGPDSNGAPTSRAATAWP